LFQETTKLLLDDALSPDSVAAKAIGYRQTIDYLCSPAWQPFDVKAFERCAHGPQRPPPRLSIGFPPTALALALSRCPLFSPPHLHLSPSVHRYVKTFATATRNYAKRQLQWYRKDGAFLWLKIDRRAGGVGDLAPYRAVCAEITHWCSQPEDCFRLALRQQVRCALTWCMCVWGG
jgi:hypothetical protein